MFCRTRSTDPGTSRRVYPSIEQREAVNWNNKNYVNFVRQMIIIVLKAVLSDVCNVLTELRNCEVRDHCLRINCVVNT